MDLHHLRQEVLPKRQKSFLTHRFRSKMQHINAQDLQTWLSGKTHFIWDFDGSLCNTERSHYEAYRRAFLESGYDLPEKNYYRDFTHLGEGAQSEITKAGLDVSLSTVLSLKKHHFDQIINHENIADFKETKSILEHMKSKGKIAIASNSTAAEIEVVLKRKSLTNFIDCLVGKAEGLRKKPFPDLFLEAHQKLSSPSATAVVVLEDSERGLQAAASAGFESILLITEFNENLQFKAPFRAKLTHTELLNAFIAIKRN
jgi:beta-phosphoglucomutase